MPSGLSAAGRSLVDPATACKVEAKKRECTARIALRCAQRANSGNDQGAFRHGLIV